MCPKCWWGVGWEGQLRIGIFGLIRPQTEKKTINEVVTFHIYLSDVLAAMKQVGEANAKPLALLGCSYTNKYGNNDTSEMCLQLQISKIYFQEQ